MYRNLFTLGGFVFVLKYASCRHRLVPTIIVCPLPLEPYLILSEIPLDPGEVALSNVAIISSPLRPSEWRHTSGVARRGPFLTRGQARGPRSSPHPACAEWVCFLRRHLRSAEPGHQGGLAHGRKCTGWCAYHNCGSRNMWRTGCRTRPRTAWHCVLNWT